MKKYTIPIILPLLCIFAATACSEEKSVPMCGCDPDEYCVDDKCFATDGSVRPAPLQQNAETEPAPAP